ncbi:MAG: hypothetical protein VX004_12640 [SAR324 cluster bacterium]|nr:hypothetical protein [SAR324 cluster bacterium]
MLDSSVDLQFLWFDRTGDREALIFFLAIADRLFQVFPHCLGHQRYGLLVQHTQNLLQLMDCRLVDNVMGLLL